MQRCYDAASPLSQTRNVYEGDFAVTSLVDLSDKLWSGEHTTHQREHHPFAILDVVEEVADGVGFYKGFSNLTAVRTHDGLALIDTGSFHPVANERSFNKVREYAPDRIHTAVYTHGHVDHAYGLPPFLSEAKARGWLRPNIVAHARCVPRMQRYIETAGYNSVINTRQFSQKTEWPTDPIYPTETYESRLTLDVGGTVFELTHGRGETDDHTWVFLPETRVLCTGDFFIWAAPNAGNPQKVQRYCIEWAHALRQMAARRPVVLLPGHGLPVYGEVRVQEVLLTTAEYLESLYRQTLALLNEGVRIDDIIHAVEAPEALAEKPWLQPIYDEPEFIVRNIYRCLAGWYSGVPSELKPAPRPEQASEIVSLAGGLEKLLARAAELLANGNVRLACHLIDYATDHAPESPEVRALRHAIYTKRAEQEPSTMSKGVFREAAGDAP